MITDSIMSLADGRGAPKVVCRAITTHTSPKSDGAYLNFFENIAVPWEFMYNSTSIRRNVLSLRRQVYDMNKCRIQAER